MPTDQITPVLFEPSTISIASSGRSKGRSRRSLLVISILTSAFAAAGIAWGLWLRTFQLGQPDPDDWYNVFYVLFARHEPAGLLIVAIFSFAAAILFYRKQAPVDQSRIQAFDTTRCLCLAVAVFAFALAAIGTQIVFHNYALTADEFMTDFQAQIFLRGKLAAQVPAEWIPALRVIQPTFATYFPATHTWNSPYLPVYAAMRAVFQSIQLQSLLNPLLAAISVLALFGTARNIWPQKSHGLIAIGLLVSSAQFLLMSMTSYAMPAHLALNTIWLWLYSRPERRLFFLAPFVGVLAIGLHQPVVHALFAAPFLLRLVWQRRWVPVVAFGLIYFAGCVTWYFWMKIYQAPVPGGVGTFFRLLNPRMFIIQPMNLLLLIGWLSLPVALLAVYGFGSFFKLSPFLRDCTLSCLITFGFYYFFAFDQAHGWGYRYFHGTLGCLMLVSVAGFERLSNLVGGRRAQIFLWSGIAASLLIQLPLRCAQAEAFVRPYARTAAVLHAVPTDIVAFDASDAWYSADLIRNDPFLEGRPVVVSLLRLTPAALAVLEKHSSVRILTRDDLSRFGMFTSHAKNYPRGPFASDPSR
jgi:hypothetical protein